MSGPAVTVLMPVLNGGRYLQDALLSVERQSYRDYELLVVDDGSSDNTPEILAGFCDDRLRVLRNEKRQKLAGALNRGLIEARGEFIARMDADDRMRPDRLMRQVHFLRRNPDIACCGGWMRPFGSDYSATMKFPCGPGHVKAFSLFHAPFAHPTVMFRKSSIIESGLCYDVNYYPAEDYELWSRLLDNHQGDNLPHVLLDYRIHEKSMTGAEWPEMEEQTMRIQGRLLNQLGVTADAETLAFHRDLSMARLPAETSSFEKVGDWLDALYGANKQHKIYDAKALSDTFQYVWFRLAMGTVRAMGHDAARRYFKGKWAREGIYASRRGWLVRGAAWKATLMGRRR